MSEQREKVVRDYLLNHYSVSELAERFSVSRKTAHKWIGRFLTDGEKGLGERSRRPHKSPNQTSTKIVMEVLRQKGKHPSWDARKLRKIISDAHPRWQIPSEITINRLLEREGFVAERRRRWSAGAIQ